MEIFAALIAVVSPVLVTMITNAVKQAQTVKLSDYRKTALRTIVALFSLGGAVATAMLTGEPLAEEVVTVAVQAVLTYIAATGIYFWDKYRTAQVEGRLAE